MSDKITEGEYEQLELLSGKGWSKSYKSKHAAFPDVLAACIEARGTMERLREKKAMWKRRAKAKKAGKHQPRKKHSSFKSSSLLC